MARPSVGSCIVLIICVMLSNVNLHYLTLAARCPVSGCWPSCPVDFWMGLTTVQYYCAACDKEVMSLWPYVYSSPYFILTGFWGANVITGLCMGRHDMSSLPQWYSSSTILIPFLLLLYSIELVSVLYYLWSPYVIGRPYIFSCCFFFFFFLLLFFPRLISAVGDWMFTILWHMVWP